MFMRLLILTVMLQSLLTAKPGDLDMSFGTDGIVITDLGSDEDVAYGVAIQSDGKIVTAGYSLGSSDTADFALVRYNTNGTLDTSFGADGIVITDAGSHFDYANSVAIQSDGKIVAAGRNHDGSKFNFALVRYDINGSLDTSFDGDGIVITAIGSSTDTAKSVVIQGNGKIVTVGNSDNGSNDDFALVRYDINGSLDISFGTNGIVTTDIGGLNEKANSAAIQSDGKIIATGFSYNGSDWDFALVRYDINGSLDKSFGTDGIVITAIGGDDDEPYGIAIQSNGKIVVVGSIEESGNTNFAIVRYSTDGSLDTTFGADGKVTTDMGGGEGGAQGIAIQSDGKIVATGVSTNVDGGFATVRYQGKSVTLAPIYYLLGM